MTLRRSCAGPGGDAFRRFEDGLRFLATALALQADRRSAPAAISAACDAVQCFLKIFEAAAQRHLPDPQGELAHLREQCTALLTTRQDVESVVENAIQAAKLARDQAAKLLPRMV